ncbi:ArsR/SmtB family transcription factor, partial [Rhodovulum sp.]|uniref:ArsR/SmtB family transcription factor n=1 Tax=Rhodovulum sp. TaxID=34009 RepID=UPI00185EE843
MPLAVLSALAKPTRLGAMAILADGGEHCVCELMARLEATQSRMSRHMKVLKLAGLVVDRRDAQWVRYRLNPDLAPGLGAIVTAAPAAAAQDSPERKVAWVPKPKPPTAAPEGDLPQERLGMVDRLKIGLDQVREIVGRVW